MTEPKIPQPRVTVSERDGSVSPPWYRFLRSIEKRVPRTGTVTFAATNEAAVTLAPEMPDTAYNVHYSIPSQVAMWTTSQAVGGFSAHTSTNITATVGFTIVQRT